MKCPTHGVLRVRVPWARPDSGFTRLLEHAGKILERCNSTHSNTRLEGLNGLFQAARARARGYRNQTTFATMIYLIAAPLGDLFDVSEST